MNFMLSDENKQNAGLKPAFWADLLLFLDLCVILYFVSVAAVYLQYPEGDVFEHIRAAFMVHNGAVPYRDFFEHHHPLLWFLTAPLVGLLEKNSAVLSIMDYLTLVFFVIGLGYIYKIITNFLSNRTAALMAVILLLMPNVLACYVYFKPDNYMFTCLAAGIYYLFSYMRLHKKWQLVLSYLWFLIGFMFMQKIGIYFPIVAVVSLYMLLKKEMPIRDLGAALVLPFLLLLMCFGYFYYHEALADYWQQNFVFNKKMVELFGEHAVGPAWDVAYVMFWMAGLTAVFLFKFMNVYFRVWSCFFAISLAVKFWYFAPHIYYYYEAYLFAVPLAVAGLMRLAENSKLLFYLLLIELQGYVLSAGYYQFYDVVKPNKETLTVYMTDYVYSRLKSCDYVLGENSMLMSVFNRPATYYWFIFGHIDVFGARMGLHPLDDFNEAIKTYRPKFVWVKDIYARLDVDENGKNKLVHAFDMNLIQEMYEITPFAIKREDELKGLSLVQKEYDIPQGLYQLKKEFDTRICQPNLHDGKWGDNES